MASQDDDLNFPGREVIFALENADPQTLCLDPLDLDRHLKARLRWFERDRKAFHALEAVGTIAATAWGGCDDRPEEIPAEAPVVVPWWVINVLAQAWCLYHFEKMPLGQAFGLSKPTNREQHPRTKKSGKTKDIMGKVGLAFEVAAALQEEGTARTVREAVATVAERWCVSQETVWGAWGRHKDAALRAVADAKVKTAVNSGT